MNFDELEDWVYEKNAELAEDDDVDPDTKVVKEFEDGWTIKYLGAQDLAREGELMGHCVGGYCGQVSSGQTMIYSLRDKKNEPHVTIEIEPATYEPNDVYRVIQVQGKGNSTPDPHYDNMVKEFFNEYGNSLIYGPELVDTDWELEALWHNNYNLPIVSEIE
jgi:hypothetical protein